MQTHTSPVTVLTAVVQQALGADAVFKSFSDLFADSLPTGHSIAAIKIGEVVDPAILINTDIADPLTLDVGGKVIEIDMTGLPIAGHNPAIRCLTLSVDTVKGFLAETKWFADRQIDVMAAELNNLFYQLGAMTTTSAKLPKRWLRVTEAKTIEILTSKAKGATEITTYAEAQIAELGGSVVGFPIRSKDGAKQGNLAVAISGNRAFIVSGGGDVKDQGPKVFELVSTDDKTFKLSEPIKLGTTEELDRFLHQLRGMLPTPVKFSIDGEAQVTTLKKTGTKG